jgi:hypothetical protein
MVCVHERTIPTERPPLVGEAGRSRQIEKKKKTMTSTEIEPATLRLVTLGHNRLRFRVPRASNN